MNVMMKIRKKNYRGPLDRYQKILVKIQEKDIVIIKQEIQVVITSFQNFFTYFSWFNTNRKNYYVDKDQSTAVANRIVNENFLMFCNNVFVYEDNKYIFDEIGLTEDEKDFFDPHSYNSYLHQDGIDMYNAIVWWKTNHKWERLTDGINQKLNEYRQKKKVKEKIQLHVLYKQIWSQKARTVPFEFIETDGDLVDEIRKIIEFSQEYNPKVIDLLHTIFTENEELDKIRIAKSNVNFLSNKYFSNWYAIAEEWQKQWIFKKDKEDIKIPAYITLQDVKNILENIVHVDQSDMAEEQRNYLFKSRLEEKYRNSENNNRKVLLVILRNEFEKLFYQDEVLVSENKEWEKIEVHQYGYDIAKQKLEQIIPIFDKKNIKHKKILKVFADRCLQIVNFLKTFKAQQDKVSGELGHFYSSYGEIDINYPISKHYDSIRNYITKKPYSEEKIKLNFDCSTLLWWWDKNKETQNLSVLLKDKNKYYLAILDKNNKKVFDKETNRSLFTLWSGDDILEKMYYKLLPGPNKMLPKCLLPKSDRKKYGASDKILELYDAGTFKQWDDFNKTDLHTLIDFYKSALQKHEEWQIFDFQFKPTLQYDDIGQFYADIRKQGYKIWWDCLSKQKLLELVDEWKLYLFEISSKDFNTLDSWKKKNLQTLYWENLFKKETNIKLNGEAEIFFRKKSIKEKVNKNDLEDGKTTSKSKKWSCNCPQEIYQRYIFVSFSDYYSLWCRKKWES